MVKYKFKEFLEDLNYGELLELQKQVKDNGSDIRKVLVNHIDVTERINAKACATCGNTLDLQTKNMTLIFGQYDFKKKASFCAFDCLEFFLNRLKTIETKRNKNEKHTI